MNTPNWCVETCDCRDGLASMAPNSCPLFVTSPPYAQGMEYEQGFGYDDLYALINDVAPLSLEACMPSGFFFVNFGETTKYERTMAELYNQIFRDAGWLMHSRRMWAKKFYACNLTGAMIHTTIPAAEWECLWTFRKPPNDKEKIRDRKLSIHGIWETAHDPETQVKNHPAAFPVALASKAITVWSDPGDLICDPFTGSGTTGVAAIELGRRFIGFEQREDYAELSRKRISGARLPLFDHEPEAAEPPAKMVFDEGDAA